MIAKARLQAAQPDGAVAAGAEAKATARFRISDGRIHQIRYRRSASSDRSVFAVGVAKGGSTLLHGILTDLEAYSSRKLLPIGRNFFSQGVPLNTVVEDVDNLFRQNGYIFGTFRWLPQRLHIPALKTYKTVLLVRDPRDMLVSAYYSFRESHPIPNVEGIKGRMERRRERLRETSLDDYVRSAADGVKYKYFHTMTLLSSRGLLLRRYEDIIFDKERFVGDIAEFFEIPASGADIAAVAKKHDIVPGTEDPKQHIRQVKPRNFESKLAPATVEEISHKLRAILCEFGYN